MIRALKKAQDGCPGINYRLGCNTSLRHQLEMVRTQRSGNDFEDSNWRIGRKATSYYAVYGRIYQLREDQGPQRCLRRSIGERRWERRRGRG